MKRLLNVILCVLIGTTVFADDGLDSVVKPSQATTPNRTLNNAPTTRADQNPFGVPAAKKQGGQKAGNTKAQNLDPFGAGPQAEANKDPFAQDPFGKPPASKQVVGLRVRTPTVKPAPKQIPSITLEDSSSSRQRIEDQLGKETKFDYLDTPLQDVIHEIALRHGIPIIINTSALEDFGIGSDTPVTISLQGVRLRSAFKLMLRELKLTFIIKDEVLQITTPKRPSRVWILGSIRCPACYRQAVMASTW